MTTERMVVVVAPWITCQRPSLAAGLVQAMAEAEGVPCSTEYLAMDLLALLGHDVYEGMAGDARYFALGEHLFATDIFGTEALDSDAFLLDARQTWLRPGGATLSLPHATLVSLRDLLVPWLLETWTTRLLALNPTIVGFTCTFNQVLPSLAIARRLKQQRPDLTILFGGACVHASMGDAYARTFASVIDHVFTGEADVAFPAWLRARRSGDATPVPGVTSGGVSTGSPEPFRAMDSQPVPLYDDFFVARDRLAARTPLPSQPDSLPFEASRGCWWGARNHCVFCGLNGEGLAFRSKSTDRVLTELRTLREKHGVTRFVAADNILRHDATETLLPALAQDGGFQLFFEVKSNMRRDDVAALAAAGVDSVQPGIESFADGVLKTMKKGVSAAHNAALLTWLAEFGITPFYNVLVGFPDETEADYDAMLAVLPRLLHLPAPGLASAIPVQVHRFAPMYDRAEALGIRDVRAAWYYRHLIPDTLLAGEEFAYFFEHAQPDTLPGMRRRREIDDILLRWSLMRVRRRAEWRDDGLVITTESAYGREAHALTPLEALVLLLCDAPTTPGHCADRAMQLIEVEATVIHETIATLTSAGFTVQCGHRVVSCTPFATPHDETTHQAWIVRMVERLAHDAPVSALSASAHD